MRAAAMSRFSRSALIFSSSAASITGRGLPGAARVSTEPIDSAAVALPATRSEAGSMVAGRPLSTMVEAPVGSSTIATRVTVAPSG